MSWPAGSRPRRCSGPPVADEDRVALLYQLLAERDGSPDPFERLRAICQTCVDHLEVTGAAIMLVAERAHQGTLYATDEVIRQLEDLQNATAEGPCIESYHLGRPVLEPDLDGSGRQAWPLLAPAALEAGIAGLFSFPLQLDDTAVGALNLYRAHPEPLTPQQTADARLLSAMATREVLVLQAEASPGSLPAQIGDLSGDRVAIEQATGMVCAQLDTTIIEAARRLRHFAGELQRPLAAVAHDVVVGKLRVGPQPSH